MQASPFERVRNSLFRSRSDLRSDNISPTKKSRRISALLSPNRSNSKAESLESSDVSFSGPTFESKSIDPPPNPRTSPVSEPQKDHDQTVDPDQLELESSHEPMVNPANHVTSDTSPIDERAMHRQLMDLESSFIPDLSPIHQPQPSTTLHPSQISLTKSHTSLSSTDPYNSSSVFRRTRSAVFSRNDPLEDASSPSDTFPTPEPTGTFLTPATRLQNHMRVAHTDAQEDHLIHEDSSFSENTNHHITSSPSVDAVQRIRLRAVTIDPHSSPTAAGSANETSKPVARQSDTSPRLAIEGTLRSQSDAGSREAPSTTHSILGDKSPQDSGTSGLSIDKQSDHLKKHKPSPRNSDSSIAYSNYAPSESILGELLRDSGGATPSITTTKPSHELSRLPSFGSIASSMSGQTEITSSRRRKRHANGEFITRSTSNLERLTEDGKADIQSSMQTPRATSRVLAEPTTTVLARHVQDVEVPDSVAAKYRDRMQTTTNGQSTNATPFFGLSKNNLTLKEQNSRMDKLGKENFDLKLKIHFLHQALQNRSDEGVKDLVSQNAQLQTDLVKSKKETQALRRRIRELQQSGNHKGEAMSASRTNQDESEDEKSSQSFRQAQMEEEFMYLRSCINQLEEENASLTQDGLDRELEKRHLAQKVSHFVGSNSSNTEHNDSAFLKEALEKETSRRRQAQDEARNLHKEVVQLRETRVDQHPRLRPSSSTLNNVITSRPNTVNSSDFSGSTLVEQLKNENANLRRDLGAQTSMLTSRNRERERLQQEIENLKIWQRHGGDAHSNAGDSILDRSVSRSMLRPTSQGSGITRASQLDDVDRERLEATQAILRDENAALKLRNQDIQNDFNRFAEDAEHIDNLRLERDEAIHMLEEERDFAADTIDRLEAMVEQKEEEIQQLLRDLRGRDNESGNLRYEVKSISDSLNRVADDCETSQSTILALQQDLNNATGELEALETKLSDAISDKERLEVQAESSQSEISFLREEQEADKIKIGDLQSAVRSAKTNLRDEKEQLREFEELENGLRKSRDEARRYKRALSDQQYEVVTSRENLEEFEKGLREALGNIEGSPASLLKKISKLQTNLDHALGEFDIAKLELDERDRLLNDRDGLLETSGLENRKLKDSLEKERQARKHDQKEFDRAQRSPGGGARLAELEDARSRDQKRIGSMEKQYGTALRERHQLLISIWSRLAGLCGEGWTKQFFTPEKPDGPTIDSIAQEPSTITQPLELALRTLEETMTTFRSRISSTEKDIYKDFQALEYTLDSRNQRIDQIEKKLQTQEVKSADTQISEQLTMLKSENKSLRKELKILKQGAFALPGLPSPVEDLSTAAAAAAAVERARKNFSTQTSRQDSEKGRTGRLLKGMSHISDNSPSSKSEEGQGRSISALQRNPSYNSASRSDVNIDNDSGPTRGRLDHPTLSVSEQKWILELRELGRKLDAEREARLLDRRGALTRLQESEADKELLRKELAVFKRRTRDGSNTTGANGSAT